MTEHWGGEEVGVGDEWGDERKPSRERVRVTAFQVLADPVRLYLVELLCVGAQTSGDLAVMAFDRFGIGWGAVSRHLRILREAGFVSVVRDGPSRWYALDGSWLDLIDSETAALRNQWERHAGDRRLGFAAGRPPDEPAGEGDEPRPSRRGRRGQWTVNRAARGMARSALVEGADGGDGLD